MLEMFLLFLEKSEKSEESNFFTEASVLGGTFTVLWMETEKSKGFSFYRKQKLWKRIPNSFNLQSHNSSEQVVSMQNWAVY